MHLRDERAGGVDRPLAAPLRVLVDAGCHTVCREHEDGADRGVLLALDEHRATLLEVAHDMDVVDDLLAHVDRCAVQRQRALNRLNSALYPGTEPTGRREKHPPGHDNDGSGGLPTHRTVAVAGTATAAATRGKPVQEMERPAVSGGSRQRV